MTDQKQVQDVKQLILQTLEQQGKLAQIKAQMRATVYQTIEQNAQNNNHESPFYWENQKCQKLLH